MDIIKILNEAEASYNRIKDIIKFNKTEYINYYIQWEAYTYRIRGGARNG